jgi:hypothetical protein
MLRRKPPQSRCCLSCYISYSKCAYKGAKNHLSQSTATRIPRLKRLVTALLDPLISKLSKEIEGNCSAWPMESDTWNYCIRRYRNSSGKFTNSSPHSKCLGVHIMTISGRSTAGLSSQTNHCPTPVCYPRYAVYDPSTFDNCHGQASVPDNHITSGSVEVINIS